MSSSFDKHRTALVTGAASGLGACFAEVLAREHYDLVLVDRQEGALREQIVRLAERYSVRCHPIVCDLTESSAVDKIYNECEALGLTVDFLVNNAGYHLNQMFHEMPWTMIEDNLQILLTVVVEMTHRFLPAMIRQKWGRILNVASVSGFMPGGIRLTTYNATKTFLVPFSEALNSELSASGIHVTALCPGFMRTSLFVNSGLTDVRDSVPSFMWLNPAEVADGAYRAVTKGRPIYIPGLINKVIVTAAKFVPRALLRERTRILHRSALAKMRAETSLRQDNVDAPKVALVTGASSGIGASFCKLLAQEGYNIVMVARREDLLRQSAAQLSSQYHVETRVIAQDLTEPGAVEALEAKLCEFGWSVNLLVNNAGYPLNKLFSQMSWPQVAAVLELYIRLNVRLIHALLPGMLFQKKGHIINVSSLAAFEPGSFRSSLYCSSKAFLIGFSESLAGEMESRNISVTVICPGFTLTEWPAKSSLNAKAIPSFFWMTSDQVAREGYAAAKRGVPVQIIGTPVMRAVSLVFGLAPRSLIRFMLSRKRRQMADSKA